MDIPALITQHTVLVVTGKGGVGKTTVSAALARLAARNGASVMLVELEGNSGRGAALAHCSLTPDNGRLSPTGSGDARSRRGRVCTRNLSAEDALVEYLFDHGLRRAARHLVNSGTLDVMATAIPGVRDILVLGKIVQLERAGTADLIVVDGPAAGHATTWLTSAQGLLDSTRAGPIRAQAAEVVELLSDPARCQVVLVTLAEETPVNETVELAFNLEDRAGTNLGPVIVNGLYPRLDHLDADPDNAAAAAGVTLHPGHADAMRAAATFRRSRQEMQAKQTIRLAEALPLPQLGLPHLFAQEIGLAEIDLLVDALETGLTCLAEPPRRTGRTWSAGRAAGNRLPGHAASGKGTPS